MTTGEALGWVTTMVDSLGLRGMLVAGIVLGMVITFIFRLSDRN
jgi:hypothetical protein